MADELVTPDCSNGDQYLPDVYNCTRFYECSNGVPIQMPCASGTHWDNELKTCNWPEQANCVEMPRP